MNHSISLPSQLSIHLRALRQARGLSQEQLGAVLGLSQARVARIEGRPEAISVGQLLHVLNALGARFVLSTTPPSAKVAAPAAAPRRGSRRSATGDW